MRARPTRTRRWPSMRAQCPRIPRPVTTDLVLGISNARMATRESPMVHRAAAFLISRAVIASLLVSAYLRAEAATEYSKHFGALSQLSQAVAEAMPAEKYN